MADVSKTNKDKPNTQASEKDVAMLAKTMSDICTQLDSPLKPGQEKFFQTQGAKEMLTVTTEYPAEKVKDMLQFAEEIHADPLSVKKLPTPMKEGLTDACKDMKSR